MKQKFLIATFLAGTISFAQAVIYLNEPFNYADGSLITVSGGTWVTHSGTTGQVDVASQKVNLTQAESEDVSASVTNVLGYAVTNGFLYASFKVNFSALPSGAGGYSSPTSSWASGWRPAQRRGGILLALPRFGHL